MSEASAEKKRSMNVVTCVDLVPPGDGSDKYINVKAKDVELPENVSRKAMLKDIFAIGWPTLMELALTQLASMVDTMMVGNLGPWAISAVSLTVQPKFLLMAVIIALNVGVTAVVARARGAGDRQRAESTLVHGLFITFLVSVIASVAGYIYAEPLIALMGADDTQVIEGAVVYFRIQMIGFPFMALTSTFTAALRGVGDTKISMIYNLVANLVNVFFNYCMINGNLGFPRMEVAGASWATIIGQFFAFCIALAVVLKGRGYMKLRIPKGFKADRVLLGSITKVGMPSMFEQLIMRAGMILYVRTVSGLGTNAYAAHCVTMNLVSTTFMLGQAFSVSATSLMGQSLGKKRPDLGGAYCTYAKYLGFGLGIVLGVCLMVFGRPMFSLYTDDAEVLELCMGIVGYAAVIQPFQATQLITGGALRGAGDTLAVTLIMLATILIIRPGVSTVLVNFFDMGLNGAWIAFVSDQAVRSILVLLRYRTGKWQFIKLA